MMNEQEKMIIYQANLTIEQKVEKLRELGLDNWEIELLLTNTPAEIANRYKEKADVKSKSQEIDIRSIIDKVEKKKKENRIFRLIFFYGLTRAEALAYIKWKDQQKTANK